MKMKLPKALPGKGPGPGYGRKDCPCSVGYKDRELQGVNPLNQQFEPSENDLLPQHKKLAGMS